MARNVVADPRLVPGGGAAEMAVSRGLKDRAAAIKGAGATAVSPVSSFSPFRFLFSKQKGKPGPKLILSPIRHETMPPSSDSRLLGPWGLRFTYPGVGKHRPGC